MASFFKKIIYYLLVWAVLGLCCCTGFSLVAVNGGYSLVAVPGLLITLASLVEEHGLQGAQASAVVAPGLQSTGSVVVVHGLRCPAACGILVPKLTSPVLQDGFLTTGPPGKS